MIRTYPEFIEAYGQAFTKDSDFIEGFKRLYIINPEICFEGFINLTSFILRLAPRTELNELEMVKLKASLKEIEKLIKYHEDGK